MILVEAVLGNMHSDEWQKKLASAKLDELSLDQWQAQKSRLRATTQGGQEIALSLERNTHLHDGDILYWDEAEKRAIVVRLQLQDVMVIHLDEVGKAPALTLARTCVELGHALGNQHWPAVVKESKVYVPLTVDRNVMASVMKTHAFEGIRYEFVKGAEVIPFLAPHETRRLFGGADSTPHSHLHGEVHSHEGMSEPHAHPGGQEPHTHPASHAQAGR
jgi:urease accessory protein